MQPLVDVVLAHSDFFLGPQFGAKVPLCARAHVFVRRQYREAQARRADLRVCCGHPQLCIAAPVPTSLQCQP